MTPPVDSKGKECRICKVAKPLTEFCADRKSPDGRSYYCRPCAREKAREYSKTDKGKLSAITRSRRKELKSPEKYKAQQQLRTAVKNGTVIKPSYCSACLNEGLISGHHEDYSKPLDVMWLCDPCHKLQHGKLVDLNLIKEIKE